MRPFLREISVVVFGVIIALSAQQMVDGWSWQRTSRAAEAEIQDEIRVAVVHADERQRMKACYGAKLDELERLLLGAGPTIDRPPFVSRYWTLVRIWPRDAWETAQLNEVLIHMDTQRVRAYSDVYLIMDQVREEAKLEQQYVADLAILTGIRGRFTDITRDRLLAAVSRARRANEMLVRDAGQLTAKAAILDIHLRGQDRNEHVPCTPMQAPMPT